MNGIRINEQKIDKFLGERTCKIKDTAYTHEVIKKLIDAVDIRVKIIILLMASTGMRVGAVSNIQLSTWKKLKDCTKLQYMKNQRKNISLSVLLNAIRISSSIWNSGLNQGRYWIRNPT